MKSKYITWIGLGLIILSCIPFSTTSIPEWKIRTVNEQGNPVPNVEVRQSWAHSGIATTDVRFSNENGFVTFPARRQFLPVILRGLVQALVLLNHYVMPHGSVTGPHATIWSARAYDRDWLKYEEGGEQKDILIVE